MFDRFDIKFVASSRETYNLLYKEIMQMPLDFVIKLPPDLQSWVSQLRPELKLEKYPRREMEVTKVTSPSEKYLIEHYQKLHKVLEQFYDQLRTPELAELCLFTLEGSITISHSYVSEMFVPAIIYEKGVIKLDVESDPLWEYLNKHLTTEFPEFSENLDDWKQDIATIVERCHDIAKTTIATQLAEMSWDSAEPDLDQASEKYRPGVFYPRLTDLIYKCLMANHIPEFPQRISDSHGLSILVMDYSTGSKDIARGESDLLDQVQQRCVDIASNDTAKEKVREVLGIVEQLESKQKPIKKGLYEVLERGTFDGTCSICSVLVAKSD